MRFNELSKANQEWWLELSRQSLEATLERFPGMSLFVALPTTPNDVWTWGRQPWALGTATINLCLFPIHRLDAPVSLFARMVTPGRSKVSASFGSSVTFHLVPPGLVKAEEAAYIMDRFQGLVGVLPSPTNPGTHEGFLARWSESLRLGQPYPGGVPIPAHGEVLPYWPWEIPPAQED